MGKRRGQIEYLKKLAETLQPKLKSKTGFVDRRAIPPDRFPPPITNTPPAELDEPVLEDDYPMHVGYVYVFDGRVKECERSGTVAELKRYMAASEIRRCDLLGRGIGFM